MRWQAARDPAFAGGNPALSRWRTDQEAGVVIHRPTGRTRPCPVGACPVEPTGPICVTLSYGRLIQRGDGREVFAGSVTWLAKSGRRSVAVDMGLLALGI